MEKKDKTTEGLRFNTETKRYRSETIAIEEEHSTATWVSLGKYLFYFSPDEEEKAGKNVVNALNEWLLSRNMLGDLVMLRGDSTSTIIGSVGGTKQHIEKLLGRKCHWSISIILSNELSCHLDIWL